jgi:hypothetical protein
VLSAGEGMISEHIASPHAMLNDVDPDENFLNSILPSFGPDQQSQYYSVSRYNSYFHKLPHSLSIFNCNIRSYNANIDSFTSMLSALCKQPEIFILTETWLSESNANLASFIGYKSFHTVRSTGRGGGVSVFVHEIFLSCRIDELCLSNNTIESCVVNVTLDRDEYVIFALYRLHGDSIENFSLKLMEMLHHAKLSGKKVVILGDFNVNILDQSSVVVSSFIAELYSLSFLPLITRATRFPPPGSNSEPSALDQIWINSLQRCSSGIIFSDISDHCPTFVHVPIVTDSSDKIKITFRNHNSQNMDAFLHKLSTINWSSVLAGTIHEKLVIFDKILNETYCSTFPIQSKLISAKRLHKPWLTAGLLKSIKVKSYYFKLVKIGMIGESINKAYKNKLTSLIRIARNSYYKTSFENSRNNLKKTWNTIGNILGQGRRSTCIKRLIIDDREITDFDTMAEEFNTFFANIGSNLDSEIPPSNTSPLENIRSNIPSSFFVNRVTEVEVAEIISKLKKTSSNMHKLPVKILTRARYIISDPLSKLINESFSCGIFPDTLKVAEIIPVYKAGDPTQLSNYRPISLLPSLSKFFEKSMIARLVKFLTKYNILSPSQFGFQKSKSTADAVLKLTEYLYGALNSKSHCLSIFVDLKKAFDTVNHNILLNKLERYGIRGLPLAWFTSYLNNRKQYVKINSSFSSVKSVDTGVPQGSVSGPVLFLLYINDLPCVSNLFSTILFADDTTLSLSDVNYSDLITSTNTELNKVKQWTVSNRLSLNVDKTFAIMFSNRPYNPQPVLFGNETVAQCSQGKFLGVTIDSRLTFGFHISTICKKLAKSVGIVNKLKNCVPPDVLVKLYYSLVYPYIIYCNLTWGGTYLNHLQPLITVQKRIVRIINNTNYYAHTNPLFHKSKILKVKDVHVFLLGQYMYKCYVNHDMPTVTHNYSTRQRGNAVAAFQRLTVTQHSITYTAPHVWNSIPDNIKNSTSLSQFKHLLKDHLVSKYVLA